MGYTSITLESINENPDPMIKIVANIIPVLNGRYPAGNVIYLGPQTTKVHRYLLVVFLAEATKCSDYWEKR